MDRPHIDRNDSSRAELRELIERLSDDDLRREVRDGWTVSALLAHLAFWDRLRLAGWELQESSAAPQRYFSHDAEQDMINAAALPALRAIPPREAARHALDAAEAIDRKISALPSDLVEAHLATGDEHERRMLDRSIHRRKHLDDITGVLSSKF
jgi:hypothetical protein